MTEPCPVRIVPVDGAALVPWLESVARLRIAVFAEWPYLYDGTLAYEAAYLEQYARAASSLVALAVDGDRVVGASTAVRLDEAEAPFREAFADREAASVCYFGESVLLPSYRGRGIGHAFFDAREAHAARWGCATAAFCAVDRAPDDPRRPPEYRPLDAFWRRRGYARDPHRVADLAWKDHGEPTESTKRLTFWTRALGLSVDVG
jgi:GNAT superfamily N-acetyltransferase